MYKYGASSILEDSESRNLFLLITRLNRTAPQIPVVVRLRRRDRRVVTAGM